MPGYNVVMENWKRRGILIWLPSLLAYIGSLFLPAFEFAQEPSVGGLQVLLLGWLGLLALNPAWLANPLFFVALYSTIIGKYRRARWMGACAVLLGSMSLLAKEWYFDESRGTPILRLGPAFYLWMASLIVLFGGSLWLAASNAAPGFSDSKQP